jgi:hypothetical protein
MYGTILGGLRHYRNATDVDCRSYAAKNGRHYDTAICENGVARKVQYAAAKRTHLALQQLFTTYSDELERVEVFE